MHTQVNQPDRREFFNRHFIVLYRRRITSTIVAAIGQLRDGDKRAQQMTLLIENEYTGLWISLRLSTLRKVIRFISKYGWDRARRLTETEKRRLTRVSLGEVRHNGNR